MKIAIRTNCFYLVPLNNNISQCSFYFLPNYKISHPEEGLLSNEIPKDISTQINLKLHCYIISQNIFLSLWVIFAITPHLYVVKCVTKTRQSQKNLTLRC